MLSPDPKLLRVLTGIAKNHAAEAQRATDRGRMAQREGATKTAIYIPCMQPTRRPG
jgi:hypothetical protein